MLFVVSSGLLSGIGKGVITASLARCLGGGARVVVAKVDPYLNFNAGRLSPEEHGEVYVLADGTEVDLDFGTYERLVPGLRLEKMHALTCGQLFWDVIQRTRTNHYGGDTVTLRHVCDAFRSRLRDWTHGAEHVVLELGGTVHDPEAVLLYQTLATHPHIHVHVVPDLAGFHGEAKTRHIQVSLEHLRRVHQISPDVVIVRGNPRSDAESARYQAKLGVPVIHLPKLADRRNIAPWLQEHWPREAASADLLHRHPLSILPPTPANGVVRIWLAGKYGHVTDAYVSLTSAIEAAAADLHLSVCWEPSIDHADRVLIPGGFGARGFEDKIAAVQDARALGLPTLGICLGMQAMVVEALRRQHQQPLLTSAEFTNAPAQMVVTDLGTLQCGQRVTPVSTPLPPIASAVYGAATAQVVERYRHQFGCPTLPREWRGIWSDTHLVWIEQSAAPWMVGVQFHPEFQPTLHPVFRAWLTAGE